jgi:hypothetical protein
MSLQMKWTGSVKTVVAVVLILILSQSALRPSEASDVNAASYKLSVRIGRETNWGSCTAISPNLIATCYHLFRDGVGTITVEHPARQERWEGKLIYKDPQADLAFVVVFGKKPLQHVPVAAEQPPIGTPIEIRGYGEGTTLLGISTKIRPNRYINPIMTAPGRTTNGWSGGGAFANGALVGVIWGNRDNLVHAVPISVIRPAIAKVVSAR